MAVINLDLSNTATAASGDVSFSSWSPASNVLMVVVIGMRDESNTINSVSGNGETFSLLADVDNTQGQCGIAVYYAYATSPTTGAITIDFSSNGSPVSAIAFSLTNVDPTTPIEAYETEPGPATDNDDMLDSITTLSAGALVIACGTHRRRTFTPLQGCAFR